MRQNDHLCQGDFFFDPSDPIYEDHFPGKPVVPGSLIMHAFMIAARKELKVQGACRVENFRFKQFIIPGCYHFRMESQADGYIRCTLYDNEKKAATGSLCFVASSLGGCRPAGGSDGA